MSRKIVALSIWLLASLVGIAVQLIWTPSSHVDGKYLPVGNDSFYHARRIHDAVLNPAGFYEFDPNIGAPDGTLVIWPWGYDRTVAAGVRAAQTLGLVTDPMRAIVMTPVISVVVPVGLTIAVAAMLGLSPLSTLVAALAVSLSPLTQLMFSIGMVDHHFAEYILILAALASGLWWLGREGSERRAAVAGAVLGVAPACHSALFLLQVPFLATFGLLWLRGTSVPRHAAAVFGLALVATTTLALLPSEPFRRGLFEFYRLSWFQLYIAVSTATVAVLLSRLPRSAKGVAVLATACVLLVVPLVGQIVLADRFLARDFQALASIHEARSLVAMLGQPGGAGTLSSMYSLLVWLAPAVLAGCVLQVMQRPSPRLTFYYVAAAAGLVMLLGMFRFHDYGTFALVLTPLLWIEKVGRRRGISEGRIGLTAALFMLLAYAPALRYLASSNPGPGGEPYYAVTRTIYPAITDVCRRNPGILLASNNDGHYIRFHTDCAVIATNFLVTKEDEHALERSQRLLSMTPEELLSADPPVRYVFARGQGMLAAGPGSSLAFMPRAEVSHYSPRLVSELLFSDPGSLPPRYHLVAELRLNGPKGYPYARLFEVLPATATPGH